MLDRDLYWYIFYKVNSHKVNEKEYVESKRIRSDIIFINDDVVYYTGDMVGRRPHGKGYATNEESEWADAAFPSTYEGMWDKGLPHGHGEYKRFKANYCRYRIMIIVCIT